MSSIQLFVNFLVLAGAANVVFPSGQLLSLRSNAKHYSAQPCNGRIDLCRLHFDQITLLGSHNSGSYGYGKISKCVYGNHNANEVDQLGRGVRFLDIDVCLRDGVIRTCHGRGRIAKILRPLEDALKDVSTWVMANPAEVIMLSFGDHDPADPASKRIISNGIAALLEKIFKEPGTAVLIKDVPKEKQGERYIWPSLGDMVSTGRRVVLAFEGDPEKEQNDLYASLNTDARDFVFNLATGFKYTYSDANKGDYKTLLKDMKHYCDLGASDKLAIHFDAFLKPFRPRLDANSSNTEIDFMERNRVTHCECNECTAKQLNVALTRPRGSESLSVLDQAFRRCAKTGMHVHAVKVDFEEYGDLLQVVWNMNDQNVQRFCPSCRTDPEPSWQKSFAVTARFIFPLLPFAIVALALQS